MKMKFETMKISSFSDFFSVGFFKDVEEDYMFNITLFGRDFTIRFFKKDSEWSHGEWCQICGEELDQA
jgi:hypothetical protein